MSRHGPSAANPRLSRHVPKPSSCVTGKVAYRKKRQAKLEADKLARLANPRRRPELRPYECQHCEMWHLTTLSRHAPQLRNRPQDAR